VGVNVAANEHKKFSQKIWRIYEESSRF